MHPSLLRIAFAIAFLAAMATPAQAAPIIYQVTQIASGTIGGMPFTNVPVTVTLTSDTSTVVAAPIPIAPNALANPGTTTVNIPGIGIATVTPATAIFSTVTPVTPYGIPAVIIATLDNPPSLQSITALGLAGGNAFVNYDLRTAIGPVTVPTSVGRNDPDNHVNTTRGILTFTAGLAIPPTELNTFVAAEGVDINQHGLTGSWYEPATSGQGVEVEVFPDPSSGMGSVFVSWFTYDTVSGGADHQRWYTAQGPVVTGQPNAQLTIYQNTGGNFNAPPVTNAQAIGTATLSFNTCTSGKLSYNFTDGTGRMGNIPLTRLAQNVTCATTPPYPTNADFALSGNWYGGAATSGQGFTAEVNPNSGAFFAAWYTYEPMGAAAGAAGQRWYTAQGTFTPGMRSIPVTIYQTTGGIFDTPTPPGQSTVAVGTGTMAFQSCSAATFSYNFTGGTSMGLSGTINLSRVGPVPPGCPS